MLKSLLHGTKYMNTCSLPYISRELVRALTTGSECNSMQNSIMHDKIALQNYPGGGHFILRMSHTCP